MRGIFIVMEGPDGSGKSTQIGLLKKFLDEKGYKNIVTREPGGTCIGEAVRNIILNPDYKEISDITEMLLYAASRAQLMHEVIGPAIEEGKVVISDRFVDSSIVYQGIGRSLGIKTVSQINAPGIGIYKPDCIFFIDISEKEGIKRKKQQKKLDRMEQESIDFHRTVSEGYRTILSEREEVIRIDGADSIEKIQEKIIQQVEILLMERENENAHKVK